MNRPNTWFISLIVLISVSICEATSLGILVKLRDNRNSFFLLVITNSKVSVLGKLCSPVVDGRLLAEDRQGPRFEPQNCKV